MIKAVTELKDVYVPKTASRKTKRQAYRYNRLVVGMSPYNAAIASGYSENYARKAGTRLEKTQTVHMRDLFEQAGVTDRQLVHHAKKGLEATKLYGKDAIEAEDWSARHRYFTSINQIKGNLTTDALNAQTNEVKPKLMVIVENHVEGCSDKVNTETKVGLVITD